jgi:hypothetical protein
MNMIRRIAMISLVAAGAFTGCGGPGALESKVAATSEHHGGILIPLTDNQAYLELLNGKREKKGKAYETNLVAYLLQSDQKTAFAETPSSVLVKLGTATGKQEIELKPAAEASDPVGSTRFVSAFGPFELTQSGGDVVVQVGGKTLSGTFRGPR